MFSSSCSYFKEEVLCTFAKGDADQKSKTIKQYVWVKKICQEQKFCLS